MAHTVFLLGAGASSEVGAPLMSNFLQVADSLRQGGKLPPTVAPKFDLVRRGILALRETYAKSKIDTKNIESVFAAFEMAKLLGRLGTLTSEQVEELPDALRRVIATTLEESVLFPINGDELQPPGAYQGFVHTLRRMMQLDRSIAVLTFNYDVVLDYAFHYNRIPIHYGLTKSPLPSMPFLKPHGSLNWVRCGCGDIIPYDVSTFLNRRRLPHGSQGVKVEISRHLPEIQNHCAEKLETEPALVPPTGSKAEYHKQVSQVWREAAKHLADAEDIFILGYSLPDTDVFFHYLFALGTVSDTQLRRVWVCNPDSRRETAVRELMGAEIGGGFEYKTFTFSTACANLPGELIGPDVS